MNGLKDGWMDGQTDGWMRWVSEWFDGCMYGWIDSALFFDNLFFFISFFTKGIYSVLPSFEYFPVPNNCVLDKIS